MKTLGLDIQNGLWNALANGAGNVTAVIGSLVVVRSLSAEAYGQLSYYLWLATVLGILASLAFPHALTKIVAELRGEEGQRDADALVSWVTLVVIGLSAILSGIVFLYSFGTAEPVRTYLWLISFVLIPTSTSSILMSHMWGHEKYRSVSVITVFSAAIQLALIFVASLLHWEGPGFAGAILSAGVVRWLGLSLTVRPHLPLALRINSRVLGRYLKFLAPATIVLISEAVVWERSEIFFLERSSTIEQVGFYNLAYTLFGTSLGLGIALVNGFYPAISRDYGAGAWGPLREKVQRGIMLAVLYAVPLTLGGCVTVEGLINLIYGEKMAPSAPVAQILLLSLIPGVITAVLRLTLSAAGKIWINVWLGLVASVFNLSLNVWLIPLYGALGGAIAATASQLLNTVILLFLINQLLKVNVPWATVAKIVLVGLFTTMVVPLLIQELWPGGWALLLAIVISGICYYTFIRFLGYLQLLHHPADSFPGGNI